MFSNFGYKKPKYIKIIVYKNKKILENILFIL